MSSGNELIHLVKNSDKLTIKEYALTDTEKKHMSMTKIKDVLIKRSVE